MNLKLRTNKALALIFALLLLSPVKMFAGGDGDDDFGVWVALDAKKKLTDNLKLGIEGELRTIDGFKDFERRSFGVSMEYSALSWLDVDLGYVFIQSKNPTEKKIQEPSELDPSVFNYNLDHAYWESRDRFFVSLTAGWKIGRVKFSLRERFQYTHTHDEMAYEDKYEYALEGGLEGTPAWVKESGAELKDGGRKTMLRSRLTAKWDIAKCKFTPFASVELHTRLDEWCGHDKIRYRAGVEYKIDKQNEISLYYLFQDNHSSKSPAQHAVGVGYSFDL